MWTTVKPWAEADKKLKSDYEPFQHYGDGHSRIPLEPIDDVVGLIPIYPLDSFAVNDLWGAAHCVVQLEAQLLLSWHARKPPLHCLQGSYRGKVSFQHNIQLKGMQSQWNYWQISLTMSDYGWWCQQQGWISKSKAFLWSFDSWAKCIMDKKCSTHVLITTQEPAVFTLECEWTEYSSPQSAHPHICKCAPHIESSWSSRM